MHTITKQKKKTVANQTYYEHPKHLDEETSKEIHQIHDWRLHRHTNEVVLLYNNNNTDKTISTQKKFIKTPQK